MPPAGPVLAFHTSPTQPPLVPERCPDEFSLKLKPCEEKGALCNLSQGARARGWSSSIEVRLVQLMSLVSATLLAAGDLR